MGAAAQAATARGIAFDPKAFEELADAIRHELTRMGVSRPMRYAPGERAGLPAIG